MAGASASSSGSDRTLMHRALLVVTVARVSVVGRLPWERIAQSWGVAMRLLTRGVEVGVVMQVGEVRRMSLAL
jgi:hypothetical protein